MKLFCTPIVALILVCCATRVGAQPPLELPPPGNVPLNLPGLPAQAAPYLAPPLPEPEAVAPPQIGPETPPQPLSQLGAGMLVLPETIVVDPPAPPPPPPKIWDGSLEFGVNGSEGNSENFNFRFIVNAKRKTESNLLTLNTRYLNNSANNVETVNRLFFEGRDEFLLGDSPWSLYVHETTEYDQFRNFDVRVTGDAGLSYAFIRNEITKLSGRFGPGVSHEFGGPDESWVPEAVLGATFDHQVSKRSKITSAVDFYPDASDFGEYRVNSQVNWEVLLDELLHVSMKFGVLDRYDSTPNGNKPNDLDYSVTILWNF